MNATAQKPQGRRILWLNVLTVFSAAILIGAEVFGAAFAAGWAFANLFHLERLRRPHPAGRVLPLRRRRHGALRRSTPAASSLSPRADGVCAERRARSRAEPIYRLRKFS